MLAVIFETASSINATPSADDHLEPIAVNAQQAAALFGLSDRSWRRAYAAGLVPSPIRIGNSVRWGLLELRAWSMAGAPNRQRWSEMKNAVEAGGPRRQVVGAVA